MNEETKFNGLEESAKEFLETMSPEQREHREKIRTILTEVYDELHAIFEKEISFSEDDNIAMRPDGAFFVFIDSEQGKIHKMSLGVLNDVVLLDAVNRQTNGKIDELAKYAAIGRVTVEAITEIRKEQATKTP